MWYLNKENACLLQIAKLWHIINNITKLYKVQMVQMQQLQSKTKNLLL